MILNFAQVNYLRIFNSRFGKEVMIKGDSRIAGFHQCRWGYKNVTIVKTVVENFKKAGIPLDTMWNDIDYSDRYLDFTHDEERFPLKEWRAFVDELHANDQHYVILVDPGKPAYLHRHSLNFQNSGYHYIKQLLDQHVEDLNHF